MWTQQLALFWKDFAQVPTYHLLLEGFLLLWVLWLLVRRVGVRSRSRRSGSDDVRLTREEEEELLAEWKPEPLVPEVDPDHPALHAPLVETKSGRIMIVDGQSCLNMATHNYLGLAGRPEVEEAAVQCIRKFGVGSCGPRAFYGTADVHVHLEERLASFFGAEQACLYSYGFSTIASAIPAYAKKGDIIFVDEGVHFAIQKALDASRSKVKYFRHNDPEHLEHLLETQAVEDKKNPKLAKIARRFLVVEGLYFNTGQICPLAKMVELKRKYLLRLIIDESVSFGTLGNTGRGITEHADVSLKDVDLIVGTLEYSVGSIGGFCVGSSYVVEHQTLAGLGYCFSASLPPMLAAGALKAIDLMDNNPAMFEGLREKCCQMHDILESVVGLEVVGDRISPIKHLRILSTLSREKEKRILYNIVNKAREKGLALTVAQYLEEVEANLPPPSIRITCSTLLSTEDIEFAGNTLKSICQTIFESTSS